MKNETYQSFKQVKVFGLSFILVFIISCSSSWKAVYHLRFAKKLKIRISESREDMCYAGCSWNVDISDFSPHGESSSVAHFSALRQHYSSVTTVLPLF